jgi:hypothetical protein
MELHIEKLEDNPNSMGKKWQQDAKISKQDAKISRHQLPIG